MATSSIFSSIRVDNDDSRRSLLEAMEAAEKAAEGRVRKPVAVKELKTKEEIEEFFK